MMIDVIEAKFWHGLKSGIIVFAYLAGEDYLSGPYQACSEGERSPVWLLAPSDAPLLRRLNRNDDVVAMGTVDEFAIHARVCGKLRRVEDAFSLQRFGRMRKLPWPQAALASSQLLRCDVTEASFWEQGSGAAMKARLGAPRLPSGDAAEIVQLPKAVSARALPPAPEAAYDIGYDGQQDERQGQRYYGPGKPDQRKYDRRKQFTAGYNTVAQPSGHGG